MKTVINPIKRNQVKSSQIKSIGYDDTSSTLEIEFTSKNNPVWRYSPVTQNGYTALINADSVGKYFHEHIKFNKLLAAEKIS